MTKASDKAMDRLQRIGWHAARHLPTDGVSLAAVITDAGIFAALTAERIQASLQAMRWHTIPKGSGAAVRAVAHRVEMWSTENAIQLCTDDLILTAPVIIGDVRERALELAALALADNPLATGQARINPRRLGAAVAAMRWLCVGPDTDWPVAVAVTPVGGSGARRAVWLRGRGHDLLAGALIAIYEGVPTEVER